MNRSVLAIVVAAIVIVAAVGVVLYTSGITSTSPLSSVSTQTGSSSSAPYYFLVFTQKGVVQLASQSGSVLAYTRLYNISTSIPAQDYYWNEYPVQGVVASNLLIPINNGTIKILNVTSMKIVKTISVGKAIGFIGVAVNQNQTLAAIADGPSGIVEVMNLKTLQVLWTVTFNTPSGSTAWPCDVRWSPNGNNFAVPMKNNDTVDIVNAQTGAIMASSILPAKTQPFMLNINSQGSQMAVELAGNKTDVFYSYPALKPLGTVAFNSSFLPDRGVYTADGKYYLEASGSSNVVSIISTSTFKQVNAINLPPSSVPGLADIELTPDSNYAFVIQHGSPATGGIIYIIPTSNLESSNAAPSASIALTTAPAFAVPVPAKLGTYLADQVLSPPVTGLHC